MPSSTTSPTGTSPAKAKSDARPRRDFAGMEARRMRAADLFAKGVPQADIGRELEVSHQTVSDWHEKWVVGGKQALKRTGQPGRPPKVSEADLTKVARALEKGTQGQWVPDRVVDARPSGRSDREGHRGEIPPRACLAGTPTDGVESAASGPAGRRTR
jgi:hypothetical protein